MVDSIDLKTKGSRRTMVRSSKGGHGATLAVQKTVLVPTIWHVPIPSLHFTQGAASMSGEDRKDLGQLRRTQEGLNLPPEVTSLPLIQFSNAQQKWMHEREIKLSYIGKASST